MSDFNGMSAVLVSFLRDFTLQKNVTNRTWTNIKKRVNNLDPYQILKKSKFIFFIKATI